MPSEEIRRRPSFAKSFVDRIGPVNASLIRLVVAEYSAASEELSEMSPAQRPHHQLTVPFIVEFFDPFHISLDRLRLLAISIVPYGFDDAAVEIMKRQAPDAPRVAWLEMKNKQLETVANAICQREDMFKKVDFFGDIHPKLSFYWTPPFSGRQWITYQRARKV